MVCTKFSMSAEIGSNGHIPCVNETEVSPIIYVIYKLYQPFCARAYIVLWLCLA
jgi:hypothetical protein